MRSRNSTSSRGQIPQIFIFIMALLIIGATIFLGMRLIGGLQGAACSANDRAFQEEIRKEIDTYASYGSRDDIAIRPPCDAISICFVDNRSLSGSFDEMNKVINTSVNAGVKTNIFLQGRDATVPVGYDPRIWTAAGATAPANATCIPAVGGRFNINAEGYGRYVIVRPAS